MNIRYLAKTLILVIFAFVAAFLINTCLIRGRHIKMGEKQVFMMVHPKDEHERYHAESYEQKKQNSCGAAAIRFLLSRYGLDYSENSIEALMNTADYGVDMLQMSQALDKLGFLGKGLRSDISYLQKVRMPVIAHINDNHFVVVTLIDNHNVYLFDPNPDQGFINYRIEEFEKIWGGAFIQAVPKTLELED